MLLEARHGAAVMVKQSLHGANCEVRTWKITIIPCISSMYTLTRSFYRFGMVPVLVASTTAGAGDDKCLPIAAFAITT
jgi:hypothetical protein